MSKGSCDNCGCYVTWKRLCLKCLKEESGAETSEQREERYKLFWENNRRERDQQNFEANTR
jgi:hypothetical protein